MGEGRLVDLKNATIKFKDGTDVTPNEIEIVLDEGNLSWSESYPMEFKMNRGKLASGAVREADEEPCSISIDAQWKNIISSSGDGPTPYEFARQKGEASSYVSTGDDCDPYCIDVEIVFDNSECSSSEDETILFEKVYFETFNFNPDSPAISMEGRCKSEAPSVSRA